MCLKSGVTCVVAYKSKYTLLYEPARASRHVITACISGTFHGFLSFRASSGVEFRTHNFPPTPPDTPQKLQRHNSTPGLTHGRGVSCANLLGGSAGGRDLAPETVRFAASLWCPLRWGWIVTSAGYLVHRRGPFSSRSAPTRR